MISTGWLQYWYFYDFIIGNFCLQATRVWGWCGVVWHSITVRKYVSHRIFNRNGYWHWYASLSVVSASQPLLSCWHLHIGIEMLFRMHDGLDLQLVSFYLIFLRKKFKIFVFISVVLFCLAAVIFPMGFHVDEIGGQPYQLPNSHQVGISYILFVLALWITVISELFAGKVCLPHF